MIIVSNPRGDAPVTVPTKPDGTYHRFEMIFDAANQRAYADTPTELLGAIIAGYADLDPNDTTGADAARLAHAGRIQVEAQAHLNVAGDIDQVDDPTRRILTAPRHIPPDPGSRWDSKIPLVLITTDHDPYTHRPAPAGNVVWLDPTTETSLLTSLATIGAIGLAEAT